MRQGTGCFVAFEHIDPLAALHCLFALAVFIHAGKRNIERSAPELGLDEVTVGIPFPNFLIVWEALLSLPDQASFLIELPVGEFSATQFDLPRDIGFRLPVGAGRPLLHLPGIAVGPVLVTHQRIRIVP
ncbi:hypothetical protein C6558_32220 [Ensifer sp. NM-2]|nr:hypothetical protein C6558_32220 [Ensifer sp. NM-2]